MLGQAGLEVLHCVHAVAQAELGPRIESEASPAAQPGAARTQRRTTHFARLLPVQDTQPRHLEEQNAITGAGSLIPWTQSPRRGRRSRRKPARSWLIKDLSWELRMGGWQGIWVHHRCGKEEVPLPGRQAGRDRGRMV